ncbi:MAG: hypothetical protein J2P20_20815, partial [Pseudonocardia sp.]|nr:hypothetical protein [Pseudonocardia sp.]
MAGSSAPGGHQPVRLARAYLSAVAEPPAPALSVFVDEHGPAEAADRVRRGQVPERVGRETAARRQRVRAEDHLRAAEAIGARLVTPEDADWPVAPFVSFALSRHEHLCA